MRERDALCFTNDRGGRPTFLCMRGECLGRFANRTGASGLTRPGQTRVIQGPSHLAATLIHHVCHETFVPMARVCNAHNGAKQTQPVRSHLQIMYPSTARVYTKARCFLIIIISHAPPSAIPSVPPWIPYPCHSLLRLPDMQLLLQLRPQPLLPRTFKRIILTRLALAGQGMVDSLFFQKTCI